MEPARWLILEHVAGNLPSVAVSFHEIPDAAAPVRGEGNRLDDLAGDEIKVTIHEGRVTVWTASVLL